MGIKYKFKDYEVKQIISLYIENMEPVYKISKTFSVDDSVIKRILKENYVEVCGGSPFSVNHWMCRGLSELEAKVKIKTIRPNNPEYWIYRGYNKEESLLKSKYHTDSSLESCIYNHGEELGKIKWGEILEKNRETNRKKSKRTIEFWINQGFTLDESKLKLKEYQTNFTIEKCIEKYGYESGIKIYNDRQKKWLLKIKNDKQLNGDYNHDSKSVEHLKIKHGDDWLDYWIINVASKLKYGNEIIDFVKNVKCLKSLREYVTNNRGIFCNDSVITAITTNKIIQNHLNIDKKTLLSLIKESLFGKYVKSRFGSYIRSEGETFKSLGEYKISTILKSYNIDYEYEKKYPDTLKKCDFYIPELDLYIEYTGLLKLSETRDDYNKIIKSYKNKIKFKTELCLKYSLNCVFLNDITEIIKIVENGINVKRN